MRVEGGGGVHRINHQMVAFSARRRFGCNLSTTICATSSTVAQTLPNAARSTGTDHSFARYEAISTSMG
jgi:hypothetical protein